MFLRLDLILNSKNKEKKRGIYKSKRGNSSHGTNVFNVLAWTLAESWKLLSRISCYFSFWIVVSVQKLKLLNWHICLFDITDVKCNLAPLFLVFELVNHMSLFSAVIDPGPVLLCLFCRQCFQISKVFFQEDAESLKRELNNFGPTNAWWHQMLYVYRRPTGDHMDPTCWCNTRWNSDGTSLPSQVRWPWSAKHNSGWKNNIKGNQINDRKYNSNFEKKNTVTNAVFSILLICFVKYHGILHSGPPYRVVSLQTSTVMSSGSWSFLTVED